MNEISEFRFLITFPTHTEAGAHSYLFFLPSHTPDTTRSIRRIQVQFQFTICDGHHKLQWCVPESHISVPCRRQHGNQQHFFMLSRDRTCLLVRVQKRRYPRTLLSGSTCHRSLGVPLERRPLHRRAPSSAVKSIRITPTR